jgi:hypothetical protein
MAYVIGAYGVTFGALVLYGLWLWSQLRKAERHLAVLTGGEGEPDAHQ